MKDTSPIGICAFIISEELYSANKVASVLFMYGKGGHNIISRLRKDLKTLDVAYISIHQTTPDLRATRYLERIRDEAHTVHIIKI